MKARAPFRSLFTTTSIAALLATTSGAMAGTTYSSPNTNEVYNGGFADFISIETTLYNTDGIDGLVVSGSNNGTYSLGNSGTVEAYDRDMSEEASEEYDGSLNGIYITDDAVVEDSLYNNGSIYVGAKILATATSDEAGIYRDAAGIRVDDGAYVNSIMNDRIVSVESTASITNSPASEKSQYLEADATAYGVDYRGLGTDFGNSGSVVVVARGAAHSSTDYSVDQFIEDTEEHGNPGFTQAYSRTTAKAVGAHFQSPEDEYGTLISDFRNSGNENTVISANAYATGGSSAVVDVQCTSSSEECSEPNQMNAVAVGIVDAAGYGVEVVPSYDEDEDGDTLRPSSGGFYNTGSITGGASGNLLNTASATGSSDDAYAYAGDYEFEDAGHIRTKGVGVVYDVNLFNGDFSNYGDIEGRTLTLADAQAQATATSDVTARAYTNAETEAKGVELHAMLLNGGFENQDRISAQYDVVIGSREEEGDGFIYAPLSAHASGGDEASAFAHAYVDASATGIEIEGLSMTDDFYLGRSSEEGGVFASGDLQAGLLAEASTTAGGSFSEGSYAQATAEGTYYSNVAGVEFYVSNLSGQFINEGRVAALSSQNISHRAHTNSVDEGDASTSAYVDASATGIHIEAQDEDGTTISGNIYNTGNVSAEVYSDVESVASAQGVGELNAEATASHSAHAVGLELDVEELQDNFTNHGEISAAVIARNALSASAISGRDGDEEGTYGDAEAYAGNTNDHEESSYVSAGATGINLLFGDVGGHIENEGDVWASAAASEIVSATAYAGDYGNAFAYAQSGAYADGSGVYIGVRSVGDVLEYVDDVDESDGYIYNGGDIDVTITGASNVSADANAAEGTAVAYAVANGSDEGNVTAYGLTIEGYEGDGDIAGSVANDGDIDVLAYLNATLNATALTSGGDTEDGLAAAIAGGTNTVYAAGMTFSNLNIGTGEESYEGLYNSGEVTAEAIAIQNTNAQATSQADIAVAIIGADVYRYDYAAFESEDASFVGAQSTGIALSDVDVQGSFENYGHVGASAFAENNNTAKADGEILAVAQLDARTQANAIGINANSFSVEGWDEDGSFDNYGVVFASAAAYSDNDADADSDEGDARAYIRHYDYDTEEFAGVYTGAAATGIRVASTSDSYSEFEFSNYYDGDLTADVSDIFLMSSGVIGAFAIAQSTNYAHANADEGDADAVLMKRDEASAKGVVIDDTEDGDISFNNNGAIFAFAGAGDVSEGELSMFFGGGFEHTPEDLNFRQEAYADADEGDADAFVEYEATATAIGADLNVSDFDNSGVIVGYAFANGSAYAHSDASDGGDQANADANVDANATGTGARVRMTDYYGDFYNSGLIAGAAMANAYAEAKVEGDEDSDIEVSASAEANGAGLVLDSGSWFDTIYNAEDGVISGYAVAHAETLAIYNDEEDYSADGHSYAYAKGLDAVGINFNDLENYGRISAQASASDEAEAVALRVRGYADYSFSGSIVNNGTIEAYASSDNPYATGILLGEGARVAEVTNYGTISAETEDTSEFDVFSAPEYGTALAIDIRGSGVSVQINQRSGEIDGAIVMENSQLDHVDWTGGTINGDIFGDYEQDVINIYASTIGDTVYNNFVYDHIIDGADSFSINGGEHSDAVTLRLTNQVRNVASVNVGPNATFNLGVNASVQTDALNLNASSTLVFDINDTSESTNGVINTGTADLGGARVKAAFVSPWNRTTDVYRIVNWNEESDTRFGSVISSDVLTKVTAEYGEDGVDLVMKYLDFADLDYLEDDATSLGLALDRTMADIDPESPLGLALAELFQLSPDQFAYEMSQIAGQQTADIQSVTISQLGSLIHVIQTQINESRNLAGNTGGDGLSFSVGSDKMKFSSGEDFKPFGGASAGDPVAQGDWRAWARVFGDWAELKASGTAPGFKSDAAGVVVGADFAPNDGLTIGLAGGYQTSDLKFGGVGKGDITSWSATAYSDYEFGNAYVDGLIGFAQQSYDMNRYLTVLGVNYDANAQYDGTSLIGAVEAGYKVAVGGQATLTPFIGLNTTHTKTDASTETGAGVWNLSYDSRSDTQVDSVLGARVSKDFKTDGGMILTPTLELGWKHGFGDTSPTAGASMAGIPGSQYTIFGSEIKPDAAIVGAALQVQMTDTFDAYVQYNGQYSGDFSENTASLRLRLKF